jgi:hypothetical protein
MSESIAIVKAIAVTALAAMGTLAFAGEDVKGGGKTTNGLSMVLVATKSAVQLGEPIRVSLSVKNQGDRMMEVSKSVTAFDCFEVTGPDGQAATYVGFVGQVQEIPSTVQPSSTVTLADGLDLTDKYLFPKPGRYAIRFRETPYSYNSAARKVLFCPSSNQIMVDVTPGQLGELDQIVAQLLPIRPKGWGIVKSVRGQNEVAPFGRGSVPGYSAHIYLSFMSGEAVYVWLTKSKAPITPDPKKDIRSEYLGRTGGLYVYVAPTTKATNSWPTALGDISRVLQIANE